MSKAKKPETTAVAGQQPEAQSPPARKGLRITAVRDGFRRGGRAWRREPIVVPLDEFTDEQVKQLREEAASPHGRLMIQDVGL